MFTDKGFYIFWSDLHEKAKMLVVCDRCMCSNGSKLEAETAEYIHEHMLIVTCPITKHWPLYKISQKSLVCQHKLFSNTNHFIRKILHTETIYMSCNFISYLFPLNLVEFVKSCLYFNEFHVCELYKFKIKQWWNFWLDFILGGNAGCGVWSAGSDSSSMFCAFPCTAMKTGDV